MLALWIALIGADRIDLLGGRGPALLLPAHVLTALVALVEWRRRARAGHWPRVDAHAATFVALICALLAICALSILRSADVAMSTGRVVLFAATAVGMPLATWGMLDRPDLLRQLGRGGALGLAVALLFGGLQVLAGLGTIPPDLDLGPWRIHVATAIYEGMPRLAGASADMNRGGLVALFHTILVAIGLPAGRARTWWLRLGAVLVMGSLSRSVGLAAVMVLAFAAWYQTAQVLARRLALTSIAVAVASAALLPPGNLEATTRALAPLTQRFSVQEGSASVHTALLARGVDVATSDIPTTLVGIGYGTSFRVLTDFFGGLKYGNFHSAWITLWAETGIFALLICLALLLMPLRRAGPFTGLLVGLAFYNVFYNGHLEPLFWVTLTLVWVAPQRLREDVDEAVQNVRAEAGA